MTKDSSSEHATIMPRPNKIAVVTGSSKGIGRAIALAFVRSNEYSGIVVNGRNKEEVEEVVKEIKEIGNKCDSIAIVADVSNENDCIRIIDETIKQYGRIDVLVNNAGIQHEVPFAETT